jgi:hypothetical protein
MHRATSQFWARLAGLPEPIQALAYKSFDLLKQDPKHPSLHFKKVGRFWSARVGLDHRVLAVEDGSDFIWVWIGNHDEYNRLIRSKT